ncbi:hypothetical protein BESB_036580 [Besnoitia besnoiti]|uniref:KRUF family protein n=1 Tax=Besnoitia besnoiti TaxID=94643 RepID=A0A2A9MNE2_BESBE|nr:hypothetical protein BESB_036580 [Besnoitia besnoiti]PFH37200.1 hypothetical protein BESB_036580 [Besnoitia besnoiti]
MGATRDESSTTGAVQHHEVRSFDREHAAGGSERLCRPKSGTKHFLPVPRLRSCETPKRWLREKIRKLAALREQWENITEAEFVAREVEQQKVRQHRPNPSPVELEFWSFLAAHNYRTSYFIKHQEIAAIRKSLHDERKKLIDIALRPPTPGCSDTGCTGSVSAALSCSGEGHPTPGNNERAGFSRSTEHLSPDFADMELWRMKAAAREKWDRWRSQNAFVQSEIQRRLKSENPNPDNRTVKAWQVYARRKYRTSAQQALSAVEKRMQQIVAAQQKLESLRCPPPETGNSVALRPRGAGRSRAGPTLPIAHHWALLPIETDATTKSGEQTHSPMRDGHNEGARAGSDARPVDPMGMGPSMPGFAGKPGSANTAELTIKNPSRQDSIKPSVKVTCSKQKPTLSADDPSPQVTHRSRGGAHLPFRKRWSLHMTAASSSLPAAAAAPLPDDNQPLPPQKPPPPPAGNSLEQNTPQPSKTQSQLPAAPPLTRQHLAPPCRNLYSGPTGAPQHSLRGGLSRKSIYGPLYR